jgi:hypothetical protein
MPIGSDPGRAILGAMVILQGVTRTSAVSADSLSADSLGPDVRCADCSFAADQ